MKLIPQAGLEGRVALREAATSELTQVMNLVRAALQGRYDAAKKPGESYVWFDIEAMYADRVIVCKDGRYWQFDYSIDASNNVQLAEPKEVIEQFLPVKLKEALGIKPQPAGVVFLEAKGTDGAAYEAVLIASGLAKNSAKTYYPAAVLKEAAPLFEGARVFAKADIDHLQDKGKDVRNVEGWISGARFVEGGDPDRGDVRGTVNLTAGPLRDKIAEAWSRGKRDLVALSIDANGTAKAAPANMREAAGAKRIATSITKVNSVDLIVDASAGGALVRLVEAADPQEPGDMKLKELMLAAIKEKKPTVFATINAETVTDQQLEAHYREALTASAPSPENTPVTREDLRMVEARASARTKIGACGLPQPTRDRLQARFDGLATFKEADVDVEIKAERDYLAKFTESGRVQIPAVERIDVEDRSKKIAHMLDAFFNPGGKDAEGKLYPNVHSFKECYVEITGDERVTGRLEHVDRARLREAIGAAFRESLDSTSFSNALGTSLTRRMQAEFRAAVEYDGWRKISDVVPVADFRTQDRINIGGYGDLPIVAEKDPYMGLTSPTDAKAQYSIAKRGGTEDVTLEMVKNDDVGAIRRIPVKLGRAAKRTLAKFVFDFIRNNPTIYDGVALFHASHGNLGSTALAAAEVGVVRTAMMKQAERDSADRLGVGPKGILVPVDLQEAAWNIFQRGTNLDKTLIQSLLLEIIPVWYWTDVNDWTVYADPMDIPGIEVGFLDNQQEPELFVQDMPNVGSMFTNDAITYKIRHIYGGAVVVDGYKAFYKEVV